MVFMAQVSAQTGEYRGYRSAFLADSWAGVNSGADFWARADSGENSWVGADAMAGMEQVGGSGTPFLFMTGQTGSSGMASLTTME